MFQTPPSWSAGSYWAPEIAQDGGRFFVYYTARKKDGTALRGGRRRGQTAGSLHGSRSARVPGSRLDRRRAGSRRERAPVSGWKEDGNSRKLPTPLWAQPLSDDGLKLTGERSEILRNEAPWEAHLVEGPYHASPRRLVLHVLFGRRLLRPPLQLQARRRTRAQTARSVGALHRQPDPRRQRAMEMSRTRQRRPGSGRAHVAACITRTRPRRFEFVGRQALLDEVTWDADGWPAINGGHGPSGSARSPIDERRSVGPLA